MNGRSIMISISVNISYNAHEIFVIINKKFNYACEHLLSCSRNVRDN